MTENITEYYELVNKSREHGQILSSLQPCPQSDRSANKAVHLAHWTVNTVLFFFVFWVFFINSEKGILQHKTE